MNTFGLWIYRLITLVLPEMKCFRLKVFILRVCGARIGKNVRICSSAYINGNGPFSIGDDVWIGEQCFIATNCGGGIQIGSYCDLGPRVCLCTGSHKIDPNGLHAGGEGFSSAITIADGCWLGMEAKILPGVTLPKKTVVAAGSVVVKSPAAEQSLIAGVPAEGKRRLS